MERQTTDADVPHGSANLGVPSRSFANKSFISENEENIRLILDDACQSLHGRVLVIWGTHEKGLLAKQALESLGRHCGFFVSSRPKSDVCHGLPLHTPDVLDASKHYVIAATSVGEVLGFLKSHGFSDENNRDYVCVNTIWHDDITYRGCSVGRGTYCFESLMSLVPDSFVKRIGRYCSFSGSARIVDNHALNLVSTHPIFTLKTAAPLDLDFRALIEEKTRNNTENPTLGGGVKSAMMSGLARMR